MTVATLGGVPIPSGHALVRVSCSPTYAMSHRWGWPDADGVMRCACCRESTDATDGVDWACSIHAIALGVWRPDRVKTDWYYRFVNLGLDVDPQYRSGDPVEAERQRCERLGVEWVGPNVQAIPLSIEVLAARGVSQADRLRVWQEFADRYDLSMYWSVQRLEWAWGEIDDARDFRRDIEAEAEPTQYQLLGAYDKRPPAHGGIVRLGHPAREADGVTAKVNR